MSEDEDFSMYTGTLLKMTMLFMLSLIMGGIGLLILGMCIVMAIYGGASDTDYLLPVLTVCSGGTIIFAYYVLRWFKSV